VSLSSEVVWQRVSVKLLCSLNSIKFGIYTLVQFAQHYSTSTSVFTVYRLQNVTCIMLQYIQASIHTPNKTCEHSNEPLHYM